ncbi:MAG TPA: cytochrome P450, partial [Acidimicrobiales bacterium]|nr:cytochrome P450 [Acidimicrobiales bacterium]
DFDHTDPTWVENPYPIWEELRGSCPIAHSERYGGTWLPTRHEDVSAIAYDSEHFSSRAVIVSNRKPPLELAPAGGIPPISSDPPFHHEARRLLLPAFSPQRVARYEDSTRAYCHGLIDAIQAGGSSRVDAATEYAQHIPVRVITDMLGFPPEDGDLFRKFIHHALEGVNNPLADRITGFEEIFEYLRTQIFDHIENPRDDLTTFLLETHTEESGINLPRVAGSVALILIAGIDTTWSAIGSSIWHLAGHPADRERLVAEPALLPTAMEEFLRAYAPVTMARLVTKDMEWKGCPMKADDWILLSFPAANRDPEFFERADEVILDRQANRHAAFGLGPHRCLGSHLARMELRVALEVWLERVPSFELDPAAETKWSAGQIRGPRSLPILLG